MSERPTWAANLPAREELDYVRSLLGAAFMVAILAWIVCVTLAKGPRAVVAIGRRQVGA